MTESSIKSTRLRLDLSQERFARLIGVSLQTVRRWESGQSRPLPIISLKLAEVQRELEATAGKGGIPMKVGGTRRSGEGEFGLGGLLRGMGSLLDLVSRVAQEGEGGASQTGSVEALGGKLKGVYGFSVRVGLGGTPVIEQFGNIQETESGAVVAETREPMVDVLDEGDHLVVIAELPGVEERDTQCNIEGDILEIAASSASRRYHKEVLLPSKVDPRSLRASCKNGILEIRLTKE